MESQRPAQNRPRAQSGFSFKSNHSKHSKNSSKGKNGHNLPPSHDPHEDKPHLSNTTKANPNAAITELQPVAAALEASTMGSLNAHQYKDVYGNPITDPDPSNPTRHRLERPLDTIRAFEFMMDGEYNRKRRESVMFRPGNGGADNNMDSRRSSSYWGPNQDQGMNGSRLGLNHHNNGAYYNQRNGPNNRDSYYEGQNRQRYGVRQHSDPALNRYNNGQGQGQGVYPQPNYGQSSATVNTGGSNGSASDQWHPSTDPSSENSSIERAKGEGHDGQQAHREPISEEGRYTYGNGNGNGNGNGGGYHPGYMNGGAPPAPPPKNAPAAQRQVIKLGDGGSGSSPMPLNASSGNTGRAAYGGEENKRKSWLKRRFSKKE
ncbi:hypothetical protein EJ08DRAFT_699964 [Tothia fuscella]|uniref:Uncharacterized protein n=1 Tax=Tothia fuscella TaxID=1048955 RepID=A0A9P4NLI2_9PEZI|nr:hypothetical protein EJ08DRAFT_699964 [Tothia fuscella]